MRILRIFTKFLPHKTQKIRRGDVLSAADQVIRRPAALYEIKQRRSRRLTVKENTMPLFHPYHTEVSATHIGCETPHAYFIPYDSEEKALRGNRAHSANFQSLCGTWDFRFFPSVDKIRDQTLTALRKIKPDKMDVPASWENKVGRGYDTPNYTNVDYPFPCDPPHLPEDIPCALYSREITVDAAALKKDAFLTFEGVSACFYLYINGAFCAYSEVSHCISEINVGDKLRPGRNRIDVLVLKFAASSYLEDQDMFRCGGIFREVYLLFREKKCIRDLTLTCTLSKNFGSATFTVDFVGDLSHSATLALFDADGRDTGAAAVRRGNSVSFTLRRPRLWSSEDPYLYTITLKNRGEYFAFPVGARKIEVKDRVILINGKKVKCRGVNRHDSHPLLGFAVPLSHMERDLAILKQNNVNMIRTSHYPCDPRFAELCDKYGFYLCAEADLETHGMMRRTDLGWSYLSGDPAWKAKYLDRAVRLYERDKNRTSVIFWSVGNEAGCGENIVDMAEYLRSKDKTRLIHYEPANKMMLEKLGCTELYGHFDMESYMYAPVEKIDAYCADENEKYPFFLCEYCHAMGNGPGDLKDYFDAFLRNDRCFGGCIWEFCDHAAPLTNAPDNDKWGYGGSFGDKPNAGNFCMDGLVYPDRRPHTGLWEMRQVYLPLRIEALDPARGKFVIRNLKNFTPLSDILVRYTVEVNGSATAAGVLTFDTAPESETPFTVNLRDLPNGVQTITFAVESATPSPLVPAATPLGHFQFILREAHALPRLFSAPAAPALGETARELTVTVGRRTYTFDKTTGLLCGISCGGTVLLDRPVEVAFTRAPMDNDMYIRKKWDLIGLSSALPTYGGLAVGRAGAGSVTLSARISFAALGKTVLQTKLTYTVTADGKLKIKTDADIPDLGIRYYPRLGILFPAVRALENVTYFGYGPGEAYIDKHLSARLSRFETTVTDNYEPYLYPQECGGHFGTHYAFFRTPGGDGLLFLCGEAPFSLGTSHYSTAQLASAHYAHALQDEDATFIAIDAFQSGCGSNSCGPVLNEKYQLKSGKHRFDFTLFPCRDGDVDFC